MMATLAPGSLEALVIICRAKRSVGPLTVLIGNAYANEATVPQTASVTNAMWILAKLVTFAFLAALGIRHALMVVASVLQDIAQWMVSARNSFPGPPPDLYRSFSSTFFHV
eukprot:gnl/MRDRNA2_/MRDRNA2_136744_c0_seq1.p2 gnl/MRDRNA2_/MRDRNA2_136744_c0~~gnl/MRDRNA2_/MRDRNA2_136744_c0_seq1.p2  ORF type:complete len:111 (-),score=11.80 gnl/MRDRNA2_/MRDRNA2_136744_c0_seq1:80-412(-)